jgi:hypothetical protein
MARAADDGDAATTAAIHELDVYYDDPTTPAGVESRRVFDIVRDRWDLRNETATGSVDFGGVADGDQLPGGAGTTNGSDPYGVAYGGGRADIRFALIDDELYLLSKSDHGPRRPAAAYRLSCISRSPRASRQTARGSPRRHPDHGPPKDRASSPLD